MRLNVSLRPPVTAGQAALLVLVNLFQIYTIKSFFEKRQTI